MISLTRMRHLLVHDWMTNWREHITLAAMVFLPFTIAHVFWTSHLPLAVMMFVIGIVSLFMGPYLMASHIMRNMRTKKETTAYAMIPATNAEKFLVRLLDYGVAPTIIAWVAALLALCIVAIFSFNYMTIKEDILLFLHDNMGLVFNFETLQIGTLILCSYAMNLSLIILGGCIFRRFALVKTWLAELVIALVAGNVLAQILDVIEMDSAWVANLVMLTVGAVAVCGAYMLFRRRQII